MNETKEQKEEIMIEYQKNIKDGKGNKSTLLPFLLILLFIIFVTVAAFTFSELLLHPAY